MDRERGSAQWSVHIEEHTGQGRERASGRAHGAGLVEGHMGQGLWEGTMDRARERAGYYDRIRVASALGIPGKSGSGEKGCETHIQYIYGHLREKGQVKCPD